MAVEHTLAVEPQSKHIDATRGQSRAGGLIPSNGERRSKQFGRVAVTYVQGSPKGGGALGSLKGINTRLSPVPPIKRGVSMTTDPANHAQFGTGHFRRSPKRMLQFRTAIGFSAVFPFILSPALAQSQARKEALGRILGDINVTPNHACTLPQSQIEERLATTVNAAGLMDDVARTVFNEDPNAKPSESGYEAMMRKLNEDTERRSEESKAIYRARETGGQTPVGVPTPAPRPKYRAELDDIKATARIPNGLNCSATARVGSLRFVVTYNIALDPSQSDGWTGALNTPTFTVAAALSDASEIRIHYGNNDLTLAQARLQGERDRARDRAAEDTRRRQDQAQSAYRNSPAGRLAALRQRQALAAKQRACEANGGTWGIKAGDTVYEVDALASQDWQMLGEACYFLGR